MNIAHIAGPPVIARTDWFKRRCDLAARMAQVMFSLVSQVESNKRFVAPHNPRLEPGPDAYPERSAFLVQ